MQPYARRPLPCVHGYKRSLFDHDDGGGRSVGSRPLHRRRIEVRQRWLLTDAVTNDE
jgi:hypothetical protein